jgi:hypothetical protein
MTPMVWVWVEPPHTHLLRSYKLRTHTHSRHWMRVFLIHIASHGKWVPIGKNTCVYDRSN